MTSEGVAMIQGVHAWIQISEGQCGHDPDQLNGSHAERAIIGRLPEAWPGGACGHLGTGEAGR